MVEIVNMDKEVLYNFAKIMHDYFPCQRQKNLHMKTKVVDKVIEVITEHFGDLNVT